MRVHAVCCPRVEPEEGTDEEGAGRARRAARQAARGGPTARASWPGRARDVRRLRVSSPARGASAGARLGTDRPRHGRGGGRPRGRRLLGGRGGAGEQPATADGRGLTDPRRLPGRDEPRALFGRTPRTTPGASKPSGKASASPSDIPSAANASPAAPKAPAAGNRDGSLWSDGSVDPHSNDFWVQSNVTRDADELTSLTVELVDQADRRGRRRGLRRSAPESDFTTTVTEKDGFLVYTWVLKDGHTLAAGQWVFAGQYNHTRGGRDAKDDRYGGRQERGQEAVGDGRLRRRKRHRRRLVENPLETCGRGHLQGQASSAKYHVIGGRAQVFSDKVFQFNGAGKLTITVFHVEDFGKLARSCGNCKTPVRRTIVLSDLDATAPGKTLVGIDSNFGDTATLSRIRVTGDTRKSLRPACASRATAAARSPPSPGTAADWNLLQVHVI